MNLKLTILATAAWITTISLGSSASAENLQHIQQLLTTKDCTECDLRDAGLILTDLTGANLSGADLTRANLSRANLTGADLTGANLTGASLNGANLTDASLNGASLSGTDLRDAYLGGAQLFGVNLNSANVRGAVGIPAYAGTHQDFYAWGAVEAERGNHNVAIANYNRSLALKPDFAPAFLGRGVARFELGDELGAAQDAQIALELFEEQGDTRNHKRAKYLVDVVEHLHERDQEAPGGGNPTLFKIGQAVVSIGSFLLRFLAPF
ncbi:MAG: tetratricopeptide repeat protein [Symploca sp. SIO2C1]|nr:tetratricopeptide repeat protein [Symploca sp. SIO2C1]